ncbi:MAG TPA: ATP-binding protein [Anaerolineae bacterium]|nr:ATP-binding protein [Anaerolineae bacterium]
MSDKWSILVIDDDAVDRMIVKRALKKSGLDVRILEVGEGGEGLTVMRGQHIDCLLVDYNLPQTTGLDVLRQMNDLELICPVIVLTGQGDERIAVELMKAGAADYLTKESITPETLGRSVLNAIRVHEAQQQAIQAQEDLRRYAAELEASNRELDAFARTVAHDLKTPLTPIMGMAELLQAYYGGQMDEQGQRFLEVIQRNAQKMTTIIDALLLLSKLRHQAPEMEDLDSFLVALEALGRFSHVVEEKDAEIIKQEVWPSAWGYGPWVEEVWANYIGNALKYGGDPPRVEIGGTDLGDGWVRFWVRDNGAGITQEMQETLFTPFTRFHVDRADGHGLGLSIVERIIHKFGGQVGVESQLGSGSEFWFTLPATREIAEKALEA